MSLAPEASNLLAPRLAFLQNLINAFPPSIPEAPADGPIARYFGDLTIDPDEGPYYSVDRAWVRTFQVPDAEKPGLVQRGPYGLQLVHDYFIYFGGAPGIEANNGHLLVLEKVNTLISLIVNVYGAQNSQPRAT